MKLSASPSDGRGRAAGEGEGEVSASREGGCEERVGHSVRREREEGGLAGEGEGLQPRGELRERMARAGVVGLGDEGWEELEEGERVRRPRKRMPGKGGGGLEEGVGRYGEGEGVGRSGW